MAARIDAQAADAGIAVGDATSRVQAKPDITGNCLKRREVSGADMAACRAPISVPAIAVTLSLEPAWPYLARGKLTRTAILWISPIRWCVVACCDRSSCSHHQTVGERATIGAVGRNGAGDEASGEDEGKDDAVPHGGCLDGDV